MVAFKGKGNYKGRDNWKGKGWTGKGKGGGKKSLNLATETEYNAVWGIGGQEDGDNQWYDDCNNGYNYSMTNQWNYMPIKRHYSMMMMKKDTVTTIGPKYFPAAI